MIVEVRRYRIKSGQRAEFLKIFQTQVLPAHVAHGMRVLGPLTDIENPNAFIWLRAFASIEAREQIRAAFYTGDEWMREIERIALPFIESYDVILTESTPGLTWFDPSELA